MEARASKGILGKGWGGGEKGRSVLLIPVGFREEGVVCREANLEKAPRK